MKFGNAEVYVHSNEQAMAGAAAMAAAAILHEAIDRKGTARMIVGTGNSQAAFIGQLLNAPLVDWSRVEAFHMDEYIGISPEHPASFRGWLRKHVANRQKLAACHYLCGDAPDTAAEIARYAALLNAFPIDVAFVGFGENGHIAFNDPPTADFRDPATVKVAELDLGCRQQQVGEGHFSDLASVPTHALTLTCPALMRASRWICCVPERRKAEAVRNALEGPIGTSCPASIVRTYPGASVYLDEASALLLAGAHPRAAFANRP